MHVGIVTAALDAGPSGPNVYLRNLCEHLLLMDDTELSLSFIHYQATDDPLYEAANDIVLSRTPGAFEYGVSQLDLDLLHYNYIPYKRPLVFTLNVPTVVTIHGDFPFAMPEHVSWIRRNVEVPLQRLYARLGVFDRIDEYMTVSNALAESINKYLDIPMAKLSTVYPGIEHRFEPVSDAHSNLVERYGLQSPFILNVNNYNEKKNRRTLLRAFDRLRTDWPDLSLVLAGGGWEESDIPSLIRTLNLEDDVTDLGFVPDEDLPLLYGGAEVLVNPTLRETFGFTNLEAMACGCPVVTTDRFAIPEVVDDAAVLISDPMDVSELANRTDKLLKNEGKQQHLIRLGKDRAATFTWKRTAEETYAVYRQNA